MYFVEMRGIKFAITFMDTILRMSLVYLIRVDAEVAMLFQSLELLRA